MEGDLMRKFFMMVAIVALALLVATPSMALDFKFGAEYRVRFYSMVGQGFDDVAGTNPRGVQTRIRPRFDVSDDNGNMTATLRLEIGDLEWGNGGGAVGPTNAGPQGNPQPSGARVGNSAGGGFGTDGVNVETKWAYIDFASPFGLPLRWRAGQQGWYLPKGIIIDDDVSGLRAYGKYSMVSYDLGWYRASGGPCTSTPPAGAAGQCATSNTQDNNLDYYQAKVDVAVAKWLNPGIYYIYGRQAASVAAEVASQNFLGATITGDVGFLRYDFDFVMGQQNGGANGQFATATATTGARNNVSGYMFDGGVHIPVGPVLIHAVGSYATGDKQDGGRSEAMPWIAPSWNGAGGLYELVGSGGAFDATETTQDYPAGLWMIGAGAEYRPVKALWLRAMYGFVGFSRNSANCAFNKAANVPGSACYGPQYRGEGWTQTATSVNGVAQGIGGLAGKSTLGHEISLRADYDLWTNFKIMGGAGVLIPQTGTTAQEYVLQLYYNF
jgi:hypothetical protein